MAKNTCRPRMTGLLIALLALTTIVNSVATATDRKFLTEKQLRDSLAKRRSVVASGLTLRQSITTLEDDIGIAVLLDRRANPSLILDVSTRYVTNEQIITTLANEAQLFASFADRFIMIGPKLPTHRLRTLMAINEQSIDKLRTRIDKDAFSKLTRRLPCSWPALSEPATLITAAASAAGLVIQNPEVIPHDLWAEKQMPDLNFSDFATLILNQFDMTFELNEKLEATLIPVAESVAIEQRHRVSAKQKSDIIRIWKAAFPELSVSWSGSTATVVASIETHEQLQQLTRSDRSNEIPTDGLKNRKFTMKAPPGTTIQRLLASFEKSGVKIVIKGRDGAELESLLQQTIEFDLSDSPCDEFFARIFEDLDADIEIDEQQVTVRFRP